MKNLLISIYEGNRALMPKDFQSILILDDKKTGFYGEAFLYKDNIIIAFRGTDFPKDIQDFKNDILIAGEIIPEQFKNAIELYNQVKDYCSENNINNKEIILTGHSLGGSLAELLGYFTGCETVVFNPYGVQNLLNHQIFLRLDNSRFSDNIRVYGNINDAVFYVNINNQIGTIYVSDTNPEETALRILTYHGIDVMGDLSDFKLFNRAIDMKYGTLTLKQYIKRTLKQNVLAKKKEKIQCIT